VIDEKAKTLNSAAAVDDQTARGESRHLMLLLLKIFTVENLKTREENF